MDAFSPWRGNSSVNGPSPIGKISLTIGDGHLPGCRSNASRVWTMIEIIGLRRLGPFHLQVDFSDGSCGEHDFSTMVAEPGPMVEPLRDPAYFDRVFIEFGAPTWPNGFDIAPEWLRREMAAAGEIRRSDAA